MDKIIYAAHAALSADLKERLIRIYVSCSNGLALINEVRPRQVLRLVQARDTFFTATGRPVIVLIDV
jgi:hypothetical protein